MDDAKLETRIAGLCVAPAGAPICSGRVAREISWMRACKLDALEVLPIRAWRRCRNLIAQEAKP